MMIWLARPNDTLPDVLPRYGLETSDITSDVGGTVLRGGR